ncbi:unnamed protein product [Onchocerca flexuosa]|uniref:Uncharacterized protein n=1 Tax=Onchocerca flexuosa TaxID=387005 RepID=A0A183HH31_9BILA|nr:unnamed protein product [Onchocerca flexuosa]
MANKQQLFLVIITIANQMIHVEAQPFIGARKNPYTTTVSKSKQVIGRKLPPCQSIPRRNVAPYIVSSLPPPRPKTSPKYQNYYLEKPAVKKFIAEVTANTSRYRNPNEAYGKVLLLMRQYFTRKDPKHRLYVSSPNSNLFW